MVIFKALKYGFTSATFLYGLIVVATAFFLLRLGGSPREYYEIICGDAAFVRICSGGCEVITSLGLPLLLLPLLLVTCSLWALDGKPLPAGHCRRCVYNLTCNVSGRCPECGHAVSAD